MTRRALDAEQLEELREAFALFAVDGSGCIDASEMKAAMQALGFSASKAEVRALIADVDTRDSGKVGFDDFVAIMTDRMVRGV